MAVSLDQVKALRDETGVSIMQCKKALEETNGDIEKARAVLLKKSSEAAQKKGDRTLGAGVVQAYVHNSNDVGALVKLSCETDFVAKNEDFIALARDIAMHVVAASPSFVRREDVTEAEMETARTALSIDIDKSKPADIQKKIIDGKLDAYFKERVLLEQPFIKQPDITIKEMLESAVQKFGENVELSDFTRFSTRK